MITKHTKSLDHVLLAVANFHKAKKCDNDEEAKQLIASGINSLAKAVECEDCVECLAQLEEEQARAHAFAYFAKVLEASAEEGENIEDDTEEDENLDEFEEGSLEDDISKELEDGLDLGLEGEDVEANKAEVDIEPKEETIKTEKDDVAVEEQNSNKQNLDLALLKLDDAGVPNSNDNPDSIVEPTSSVHDEFNVENDNAVVQEEGADEVDASLVELCARLRQRTDSTN